MQVPLPDFLHPVTAGAPVYCGTASGGGTPGRSLVLERGKTLTGVFQPVKSRTLGELKGVEGPEAYLLPDNRTWCLIADRFHENRGYLPMLSRNLEKGELEILPDGSYDMGKSMKRHDRSSATTASVTWTS